MQKSMVWLGVIALVGLSACKDDEPLLGFDQLCPLRAEHICSVRVPPCCAEDARAPDCVEQETAVCEAERETIAGIEGALLRFHGSHASDRLDEELGELEQCLPPRPLPFFFDGALAEGAACQRDTQCVTGSCGDESGLCESAPAALCPES